MELYLVRHGQSEANAAKIMQGAKIDRPLTPKGIEQAKLTRDKLVHLQFDRVFVSPLRRASQTAEVIVGDHRTVRFDPRLVEFDYGQWDGQPILQLVHDYPQYFKEAHNFKNAWKVSGGESYDDTYTRLRSFMHDDLDLDSDQNVLVVSHGMTIKLWVAMLLSAPEPERLAEPANAGVTHISFYHGMPILKAYSH